MPLCLAPSHVYLNHAPWTEYYQERFLLAIYNAFAIMPQIYHPSGLSSFRDDFETHEKMRNLCTEPLCQAPTGNAP